MASWLLQEVLRPAPQTLEAQVMDIKLTAKKWLEFVGILQRPARVIPELKKLLEKKDDRFESH